MRTETVWGRGPLAPCLRTAMRSGPRLLNRGTAFAVEQIAAVRDQRVADRVQGRHQLGELGIECKAQTHQRDETRILVAAFQRAEKRAVQTDHFGELRLAQVSPLADACQTLAEGLQFGGIGERCQGGFERHFVVTV